MPAFRRLWVVLAISSFGDWLGLLATTGLAAALADDFRAQTYAIGGVLFVRLLPDLVLSPFAGAVADRFDRRRTMVVADLLRFVLFLSIPIVGTLPWLIAATFLIESVSLFWIPAKEASVPRLVPPALLEPAMQVNLVTTYGTAVVSATAFALLSVASDALGAAVPVLEANPVALALYVNAATFLFAALSVARIRELSGRPRTREERASGPGVLKSIVEGWSFVGHSPLVRGLVVGILGATAGGGIIVATGRLYSDQRGGGDAGYGVLFAAVFLGLAAGMALGPRLLPDFPRRRLFGLALVGAGVSLAVTALVADLVLAVLVVLVVGAFTGIAWVCGYTLLGGEVADEVRGRTFALLQSLLRVDLLLVLSVTPFLVGAIGDQSLVLPNGARIGLDGVTVVLFVGGVVAVAGGVLAYRQMDDRRGVGLRDDLMAALRREPPAARPVGSGLFVVFEGGEGAGKSTQARRLADHVAAATGREVVLTREPGGTPAGRRIRELLLDPEARVTARAEALLYAADRAEHVVAVVRPALERDAVVISDRYVDSSLAYQGAGRVLAAASVRRLSAWATEGLVADLTVLLDVRPAEGLERASSRGAGADRLEAEDAAFHERVRRGFLDLAAAAPERYLVVPAGLGVDEVAERVRERVDALLGVGDAPRAARRRPRPPSAAGEPPPAPEPPGQPEPPGRGRHAEASPAGAPPAGATPATEARS